jgi:hypothetical protein
LDRLAEIRLSLPPVSADTWIFWRNLPREVNTVEASEDADVLEVSTPHHDDVVWLQDDYGGEGTSAP